MPRSPEATARWRAAAKERREQQAAVERAVDCQRHMAAQGRERRRDEVAAQLADRERQAMAAFRARGDVGAEHDGEAGP